MARVSGERAPAFIAQELEKPVDGVLPQYTLLYGPPDQQFSAHQKKDIWRAIAKDVRTLGVHQRRSTLCHKKWEDIRRWSKKTAEAQLGMASQRGRGACCTTTPLMFRILAVACPELDGRLRASQQRGSWTVPDGRGGRLLLAKPLTRVPGGSVESAVAPPTVGKGQKKAPKSGKSSTAEKAAIIPAAQDAPASLIVTGQETTTRVSAQQGSPIVTGQETTARVSAQESSPIVTGQETTARVSGQEGSPLVSGQETTAKVKHR
ncbi:hypothetical protein NDU88_011610 [Pleurodeles waltl]|uniref:Myb/SANT-like DNA-binding domain-containing protein n=1 Tax=Pleurodeles waltl TaxID=8319 RepID=A0AAV7S6Q9_PLEWA|nr:hypothetical protein NDU88_011610 [Pleurodeles waltl]